MTQNLENINVSAFDTMPTPAEIHAKLPLSDKAAKTVSQGRNLLRKILDRKDHRLFVVVGPCSIHDPVAGLEYARRLKALYDEVSDTLLLVMRVYFEKPRTTVGWKGYINDPDMDDSFRVDAGMAKAREFLLAVNELGLSTPVGFKNGTNGDLTIAINAILSASRPHSFLGINSDGRVAIVRTKGNPYGHIVLRGGDGRPNYDTVSVTLAENAMTKAKLQPNVIVDCSHANSNKNPELQPLVMADVISQIVAGNRNITGLMIESNLVAGNQRILADRTQMTDGCSVTDGCVDWATTEQMIRDAAQRLRPVLAQRAG